MGRMAKNDGIWVLCIPMDMVDIVSMNSKALFQRIRIIKVDKETVVSKMVLAAFLSDIQCQDPSAEKVTEDGLSLLYGFSQLVDSLFACPIIQTELLIVHLIKRGFK